MKYFKILIILIGMTYLHSKNVGLDLSLVAQVPKGEFAEQEVPTGFGIDLNGLYFPVKELGFGLNLGYSVYGYSQREIPFNYFTNLVTITEKTTNELGYGHLFFRIVPFNGNIKPYFEGLVGLKNLSTKTELVSNNCTDEDDNCQIAKSTNASDTVFSYGFGGGLQVKLTTLEDEAGDPSGDLSFFINARYLMGSSAKYLKKGSIVYSEPEDGPVQTSFNWNESKTDLLQLSIGINFSF
tara:strand:+ start:1910 stop:2626 length:717 start_codon:yes stop_codon:yes gene_type:complete